MNALSSAHFGRFQINPHDRLIIEGKTMRLAYQNTNGYVLRADDGVGRSETFDFSHLSRLSAAGRIQHDPDFFAPETANRRQTAPVSSISDLKPKQKKRLRLRQAYVMAFLEMQAEGLVAANDASIAANMEEICNRGRAFAEDHAPDHAGFSGVHVQQWLSVRRSLKTKDPAKLKWREDVVCTAIKAIVGMNTTRSLEFGLISQNTSTEKVQNLEDSLFSSFIITEAEPISVNGPKEYGQVLEPSSPEEFDIPKPTIVPPQNSQPAKKAWTVKKGDE